MGARASAVAWRQQRPPQSSLVILVDVEGARACQNAPPSSPPGAFGALFCAPKHFMLQYQTQTEAPFFTLHPWILINGTFASPDRPFLGRTGLLYAPGAVSLQPSRRLPSQRPRARVPQGRWTRRMRAPRRRSEPPRTSPLRYGPCLFVFKELPGSFLLRDAHIQRFNIRVPSRFADAFFDAAAFIADGITAIQSQLSFLLLPLVETLMPPLRSRSGRRLSSASRPTAHFFLATVWTHQNSPIPNNCVVFGFRGSRRKPHRFDFCFCGRVGASTVVQNLVSPPGVLFAAVCTRSPAEMAAPLPTLPSGPWIFAADGPEPYIAPEAARGRPANKRTKAGR